MKVEIKRIGNGWYANDMLTHYHATADATTVMSGVRQQFMRRGAVSVEFELSEKDAHPFEHASSKDKLLQRERLVSAVKQAKRALAAFDRGERDGADKYASDASDLLAAFCLNGGA